VAAGEALNSVSARVREIVVHLNRPEQLFVADPIEPWSSEYNEFTAQPAMVTVRDMLMARMPHRDQEVCLVVVLPQQACKAGLDEELTVAVRRWIRVRNLIEVDITHADGAVGRRLFAVSSLVFMVLQTLSILVKSMGDSVDDSLIDAVGEGLSVASWVMLWFPIQLFTVEVWRSSIRRRRSTVMERMTVQVQPRS
jgi:hypothetical protein